MNDTLLRFFKIFLLILLMPIFVFLIGIVGVCELIAEVLKDMENDQL